MGNYANTHFLPDRRIFGLSFDIDGNLFSFPYIGLQSFMGNVADFDVMGGRLYLRPLLFLSVPIIKNLEIGGTFVADIDPYAFVESAEAAEPITVWGVDFKLPVLSNPVASMLVFGDFVNQNGHTGGMIGLAGKLFGFLPYGAQLRILGDDFIPMYFGEPYDMFRTEYYTIANNPVGSEPFITGTAGWFASTGFSLFNDLIALNLSIDGPFEKDPDIADDDADSWVNYPHLRGSFSVGSGLIPGFSFKASLDKRDIKTFADLIDFSDAVIGAEVNYQTGPTIITLAYDVRYNPATTEWETIAKLQTSFSLF